MSSNQQNASTFEKTARKSKRESKEQLLEPTVILLNQPPLFRDLLIQVLAKRTHYTIVDYFSTKVQSLRHSRSTNWLIITQDEGDDEITVEDCKRYERLLKLRKLPCSILFLSSDYRMIDVWTKLKSGFVCVKHFENLSLSAFSNLLTQKLSDTTT